MRKKQLLVGCAMCMMLAGCGAADKAVPVSEEQTITQADESQNTDDEIEETVSAASEETAKEELVESEEPMAAGNEEGRGEEQRIAEGMEALKAYAFDPDMLEGWTGWRDGGYEYMEHTKGYLTVVGEQKIPIMVLTSNSVIHASGYTWVYKYVDGEVVPSCSGDWVERIDLDTGLLQTCYQGGGYCEVNSYYHIITNTKKYDDEIAYSAILYEDDPIFYYEGEYDEEFYLGMKQMFGEDIFRIAGKDVTKEQLDSFLSKYRSDNYADGIEDIMESVAEWK